jgi:hypothetical protein
MNVKKVTTGFVTQVFDKEGNCLSSEFTAGEQVEWEEETSDKTIDPEKFFKGNVPYYDFNMLQPGTNQIFE